MLGDTGSGRAYNVGAGQRITVNEIASAIIRATHSSLTPRYEPPRAGDVMHSLADTRAIQEAFGWIAKTSISEGLMQSAAYY